MPWAPPYMYFPCNCPAFSPSLWPGGGKGLERLEPSLAAPCALGDKSSRYYQVVEADMQVVCYAVA